LFAFVSVYFLEDIGLDLGAKALMPFLMRAQCMFVRIKMEIRLHAHADVQDLAVFAMLKALKLVLM
jgi:hypothetical protein